MATNNDSSAAPAIDPAARRQRIEQLHEEMKQRILVLDGGWGSLIQGYRLEEADFRGERFKDWHIDLKGNGDLLNLTRPDIVREIHEKYLAAGADITSTNTFTSSRIAQADYDMSDLAYEMNQASASLAREVADRMTAEDGKVRWVAGALGPTNRTASLSPDVNDPGARNVTFDELRAAYREAAEGLLAGGADILLIETIFDTLNAKAAIVALEELFEEMGERIPVMISGTIVDLSGRNLSGQTVEAFWISVEHARPISVGLNCALGADQMRPHITDLSRIADVGVSAYPNAGLPNDLGEYDETPEDMSTALKDWARDGLLNIVGSCCGSTPEHTRAIAEAVRGVPPRPIPEHNDGALRLSGLEPFILSDGADEEAAATPGA